MGEEGKGKWVNHVENLYALSSDSNQCLLMIYQKLINVIKECRKTQGKH